MTMRVHGPDGIVVNFPDGADPGTIDKVMRQAMEQKSAAPAPTASPPANQPDTMSDVAQSAGAGLVRGASGLAGMEGDINQLAGTGVDWLKGKMGMDTSTPSKINVPLTPLSSLRNLASSFGAPGIIPDAPTSQQVQGYVEKNVTGPAYEPQTTAGKYARTIGEFAPAAVAGPGGIARRVAQQAVVPAVTSELAGETFEGTPVEPYARAAGAAAGGLVPGAAARLLTPFPAENAARKGMADILKQEGVSTTAGQATGNKSLQYLESEMGGPRYADAIDKQGQQFTSAVLSRIGEDATHATPDVMDRAFNRIGKAFDDVAARNTLVVDHKFAQDLGTAVTEYRNMIPPSQQVGAVQNMLQDISNAAHSTGGAIHGDIYQSYRSRLEAMARKTTDVSLAGVLRDMRSALDDAMERSIAKAGNIEDIAEWRGARRQYKDILVVERALGGAGEAAGTGIITPARLRMAAIGKNRRGFIRGKSNFTDLAQAGQAVMTPLPQSGTAPRLAARRVPEMLSAIAGGSAGHVLDPSGMGMAAGIAAGTMIPKGLGYLAMSKGGQKLLGNQKFAKAANMSDAVKRAALVELIMGPRQFTLPPPQ